MACRRVYVVSSVIKVSFQGVCTGRKISTLALLVITKNNCYVMDQGTFDCLALFPFTRVTVGTLYFDFGG